MYKKIDRLLQNVNKLKYWDLREQTLSKTNVVGWNNEVKDMVQTEKSGISFRVLVGSGWGFAYSHENNLKKVVNKAVKIAQLMNKNSKGEKEVYLGKAVKDDKKSKWKINPKDVSLEEKKNLVLKYSKLSEKKIVSKQAIYFDINNKSHFMNSVGSDIRQEIVHTFVRVISTAKSDFIQYYFATDGQERGFEVTSSIPQLSKEADENALALLKSKMPKGGKMNIIADSGLTDVFIHEALGHASEADHILENQSCLKGKIGKKIAPNNVTVIDDSRGKNCSWGGYFYDEEGIKSHKTEIIKNGVLKTYLHSRETAKLFNAKPTGNARAQDVSFKPCVRMSNTYIEKGDHSFEEMLQELKNGYYLVGSKGGEVDPAKGVFQFSCVQGFEVKNGELGERLRNVALSGNTLLTLNNITAMTKKYYGIFVGFCGKSGQTAFAAGDCPRILIKNAIIGGN